MVFLEVFFWACGWFRWIENFSRIRMVLTRASGTARASRLRRYIFWMDFGVAEGLDGYRTSPGFGRC